MCFYRSSPPQSECAWNVSLIKTWPCALTRSIQMFACWAQGKCRHFGKMTDSTNLVTSWQPKSMWGVSTACLVSWEKVHEPSDLQAWKAPTQILLCDKSSGTLWRQSHPRGLASSFRAVMLAPSLTSQQTEGKTDPRNAQS